VVMRQRASLFLQKTTQRLLISSDIKSECHNLKKHINLMTGSSLLIPSTFEHVAVIMIVLL